MHLFTAVNSGIKTKQELYALTTVTSGPVKPFLQAARSIHFPNVKQGANATQIDILRGVLHAGMGAAFFRASQAALPAADQTLVTQAIHDAGIVSEKALSVVSHNPALLGVSLASTMVGALFLARGKMRLSELLKPMLK
jgi:hypothetical protein